MGRREGADEGVNSVRGQACATEREADVTGNCIEEGLIVRWELLWDCRIHWFDAQCNDDRHEGGERQTRELGQRFG